MEGFLWAGMKKGYWKGNINIIDPDKPYIYFLINYLIEDNYNIVMGFFFMYNVSMNQPHRCVLLDPS